LVNSLKTQINECENESTKLILKERLSKFEGGVAIIKVGAGSPIEAREKVDRIDDALGATKAAISEGIIVGGGLALINAVEKADYPIAENKDVQLGIDIIKDACSQPFKTILSNAGINSEVVLDKIKSSGLGFNVKTGEYVDMISSGIIDPVKVTRTALENAVSVASLLITTDCLMVQVPKTNQ